MQKLLTSTTEVSQENNFNGHAYTCSVFLMVPCTILYRQKERQSGGLMEGTEEKKDGQTEGQAIRWKKIQQDTKADQRS